MITRLFPETVAFRMMRGVRKILPQRVRALGALLLLTLSLVPGSAGAAWEQIGTWGSLGSGQGQFNVPQQIAVHATSGNVLVADRENSRIAISDGTGNYLNSITMPAKPYGVAVDQNYFIYVTLADNTVRKYQSNGTLIATSSGTTLISPRGIAVDTVNNLVYLADSGNHRVVTFNTQLIFQSSFNSFTGATPGTFSTPVSVAVELSSGKLFVSDSGNRRVLKFTVSPSISVDFVEGTIRPSSGVAVDNRNNNFFAGTYYSSVFGYLSSGGMYNSLISGFSGVVNGISPAVSANGELLVSDSGNNRIVRYVSGPQPQALDIVTLPKTGQAISYSPGDDGAIQAGAATPSPRFTEVATGTMTDNLTGLIWSKDPTTAGSGCNMIAGSFSAANTAIACLNTANYKGFSDWRLPNVNELRSLLNLSVTDKAGWLISQGFTNVYAILYFTSTMESPKNIYVIDLGSTLGIGAAASFSTAGPWPVRNSSSSGSAPLPKTGQTSCFSTALDGSTTPCSSVPFADGAVQAGFQSQQPRFINNLLFASPEETMFDSVSGLTWATINSTTPSPCDSFGVTLKTWQEALDLVACLNTINSGNGYLGYSDWRLPNLTEAMSLANYEIYGTQSSVDYGGYRVSNWYSQQGINIPYDFWTSTTDPSSAGLGYVGNLNYYSSQYQNNLSKVAPVRGGKNGPGIAINNGARVTASRSVVLFLSATDSTPLTMSFSNDGINWYGGEPYANRKDWYLPNPEGIQTVYVKFTDSSGNSSVYSDTITLDTVPPIVSIDPAGGYYNNPLVTISANEPAILYLTTDRSTPTTTNSSIHRLPYSLSLSSTTTLKYYAVDAAGNSSAVATALYTNDTIPPIGTTVTISRTGMTAPDYYTGSRSVNLTLAADGTGSPVVAMKFSSDNTNWSDPEPNATSKSYTIDSYGDGKKNVFASFKDQAGNWSSGIMSDNFVTLDSSPAATTVSHTNVWYTAPVTVTLSCTDAAGPGCSAPTCYPSGCSKIYYTTDGSNPGISSPYLVNPTSALNFSAQLPAAISTSTDLRYASLDRAGNLFPLSSFPVQQFRFDSTAPTVALTAPTDGAKLTSLPAVSGTAADSGGSGLKEVQIQITDGTNYVQQDRSIGTAATWITVVPVAGSWSFDTSTMTNWSKPGDYTVTAKSIDYAGNVSTTASRTFSIWNRGDTVISFVLSSQSIKNGGNVSILGGKLTRIPEDPNYHLNGQTVTVTVSDPPAYAPNTASYTTTTTDSAGHFQLNNFTGLGGFTKEGTYTVTASFAATPVLTSSSASLPVLVGSTAGYAIIVEGKLNTDPEKTLTAPYHNLAHSKTAQRVYDALKARGFADADIYNLNYATGKPGVDAAPDKTLIQTLITSTGANYSIAPFSGQSTIFTKMVSNPGPLYIVMVDHGDPDKFYIDTDSATVTITPTELNGWLNTLETALTPYTAAAGQKRIIINGSCYSGSFIPVMSKSGRVIVTSAAFNEQSFKGAMEYDGVRSGEFFLEELFGRLKIGDSFKSAFDYASDKVRTYTRSGSSNSATAPYFDTAIQHPLLDDDASGSGSNSLSTASGDGVLASGLYLGFASDTTNAGSPASILTVTDTRILASTENSAPLSATTANYAQTLAAWVEIRDPDTLLAGNSSKTQLDPTLTRTPLLPTDPNAAVTGDEYFGITYNNFTKSGMYEIYYYAQESIGGQPGNISPMKRSVVYRKYPGNDFPAGNSFSLVSPANGATLQPPYGLIFEWGSIAPSSAPNNSVTYTLEIADNIGFTNNGPGTYYKRELISGNTAIVGSEGGLKSSIPTYYWKVTAVDRYGATKAPTISPFTFGTGSGNINQITAVTVQVYDSVTMAAVNDAVVRVATTGLATSSNSCTSGKLSSGAAGTSGQCSLAVNAGVTLSLEATKAGSYELKSVSINAPVTSPPPVSFPLVGTALQPLKIGASYYADLASAYTAAAAGSTIQLKAQTFTGPFSFNKAVAVTLEGGYDATYSATRTGYTELTGPVTINGLTGCQVTFDRVVVK